MVTTLNNVAPLRDTQYTPTGSTIVRKNVTFNDAGDGEIVVGTLPPGGYIGTGSGIWVKTAFVGTGVTIDVGVAGTPTLFASAMTAAAIAFTALDDLALAAAVPTTTTRNLVVRVNGTTVTAGSADIILNVVV